MTAIVREGTIAEIFDNSEFAHQADTYYAESGVEQYGRACPDRHAYEQLEEQGDIRTLVATVDGRIVGFAVILRSYHYHYSKPLAALETLWLDPDHRQSGIGLRLIYRAKEMAADMGYDLMTASAPAGSRLAYVYSRLGTKTDEDFIFELEPRYES